MSELRGTTDSELLFAYLLSRLDDGGGEPGADQRTLAHATIELGLLRGSFNFVLSNGRATYAHRRGRALHALLRRAGSSPAIVVASEPITPGDWRELPEGMLFCIQRSSLRLTPLGANAGATLAWTIAS